jgi:hypothetical protein
VRHSTTERAAALWIATLAVALTLGGCLHEPFGTLVTNHTKGPITVVLVDERGETNLGSVAPDLTLPLHPRFGIYDTSCTPASATLVVRAGGPSGPELESRTQPLCYRDEWVIEDPARPSS